MEYEIHTTQNHEIEYWLKNYRDFEVICSDIFLAEEIIEKHINAGYNIKMDEYQNVITLFGMQQVRKLLFYNDLKKKHKVYVLL